MSPRVRAALVIGRRQAYETLLSPGLWITSSLGLLAAVSLVRGFTTSIDSAGFNPSLSLVYDVLNRLLAALFGSAPVGKLFAEGPFLLALAVAYVPVLLFLAISSVFRFALEKGAGAVELITYGPADGTSYVLASFVKDAVFSAFCLLAAAAVLAVTAVGGNLVLGPAFFLSLGVLLCLSLAVFAWGHACSVATPQAASALALFLGLLVVFSLLLAGSLSISGTAVGTAASAAGWVLQWFSPFYWASLASRAAEGGSPAGAAAALAALIALTGALLALCHVLIRRAGVRS